MKKVRFETPNKSIRNKMEHLECHSPRPFIEKQETSQPKLFYQSLSPSPSTCYESPRLLPYSPDPVQRYECSNSSPYPMVAKTSINKVSDPVLRRPSNDLELSMLDSTHCEPRQPNHFKQQNFQNFTKHVFNTTDRNIAINPTANVLASVDNNKLERPVESNNFFIKRDYFHKIYSEHVNPLQSGLNRLSLGKENDPLVNKAALIHQQIVNAENENIAKIEQKTSHHPVSPSVAVPDECRCHHCVKIIQNTQCSVPESQMCKIMENMHRLEQHCACLQPKQHPTCPCSHPASVKPSPNTCNCQKVDVTPSLPQNAVDKKAWILEKYEQNKNHDGMTVEKPNNVVKEKREPTVSDLFKIIKLQNEQLQLLQEKVDKFISASNSRTVNAPLPNYVTEHVTLGTVDSEQHKISIGVMTSFEMVRTSTVINKEVVTQTNDNAHIQCNKSQISIKEVVSKSQPETLNFLDGIMPTGRTVLADNVQSNKFCDTIRTENMNDDKTLNELSLYNVQIDNATTPFISPEQSLYLDVRDYSDSESGDDDHSNVGWTYYNKIMTHVNGVLQDSEMPSSASALFRNTKQQCVQMQIDKTNVSVTKRVKFGDDPLGVQQPHIYAAATDTSLKMNQLAAKYLKNSLSPAPFQVPVAPKPTVLPYEMSFATRNYMERHRILQGTVIPSRSPTANEIPRFLDITALKQQPKLL